MASPLRLLEHGVKGMDLGKGLIGYGVNGVSAYFAGRGIGYAYNKYPDKDVPRWTAVGGKLSALVLAGFTGPGIVSGLLDTVGNSGLAILGCEHELTRQREKNNIEIHAVTKGTALPAGGRRVTRLGELPAAAPGVGMPWPQVFEMASMP